MDVELFLVAQKVESGLRNHDTQPCLAWCHENRSKLKKLKVYYVHCNQDLFTSILSLLEFFRVQGSFTELY